MSHANAIILAAGLGERAAPLTFETPKGLLKVYGVPMIERQIEQLLEKEISEIVIVVGYMKEKFDYLIDKYGVELVFNPEFAKKNNLASLYFVRDKLNSTYLIMSDIYMTENIFSVAESTSWSSCPFFTGKTDEWIVSEKTQDGIIREILIGGENAYGIQGPAYFSPEFSTVFKTFLEDYYNRAESKDYYWEHILKLELKNLPPMYIKDTTGVVYEFENLEELRRFDTSYFEETNNLVMQTIANVFKCSQGDVSEISVIKEGMSNRSFKFALNSKTYVFRLPGADTGKLVNRQTEKEAYEALAPYNLTDKVIFFDGSSGIKISEFIEDCHNSDPYNDYELKLGMEMLAKIHKLNIKLSSDFDIENKTFYYTKIAKELNAIRFLDFDEMTVKMKRLYKLKKCLNIEEFFCHGDFLHANVLVLPDKTGKLIDFEFCGNGDPIMDVSMYSIFSDFDSGRMELALQFYLGRVADEQEKLRLYLYAAIGAFLWTVWGEYKQANGSEFGDYMMKQYRYAKKYYKICEEMAENL